MKLHLGQVNLVSSDVPASVEFYRLLGLTIEDTLPEWESQHRTVEAGEVVDLEIDGRAFASIAIVLDPSGVAVGFMSPMDNERRTAMPDPSTFR